MIERVEMQARDPVIEQVRALGGRVVDPDLAHGGGIGADALERSQQPRGDSRPGGKPGDAPDRSKAGKR